MTTHSNPLPAELLGRWTGDGREMDGTYWEIIGDQNLRLRESVKYIV